MAESKTKTPKAKFTRIQQQRKHFMNLDDPLLQTFRNGTPREIHITDLQASREYELTHFLKTLKMKFSNKLSFQTLPHHLRRRAQSHNYYKIPFRLRFKNLGERIKQGSGSNPLGRISRCRKHRRKPFYLLHLYERRRRKHKWLETHIWHAKRFKMKDLYGYKIPYKINDKSKRSVYKFCMNSSLVFDHSWLQWIQIHGDFSQIKAFMRQFQVFFPPNAETGKKMVESIFWNECKQIGPIEIIVEPTCLNMKNIWLCVHPSIKDPIIDALKSKLQFDIYLSFSIEPLEDELNCFEIIGKESLITAYRVLSPLILESPCHFIMNPSKIMDVSLLPNNSILGLKLISPTYNFSMENLNSQKFCHPLLKSILQQSNQLVKQKPETKSEMEELLPQEMEKLLYWDEKYAVSELWHKQQRNQMQIQVEWKRFLPVYRFSHRKKPKDIKNVFDRYKEIQKSIKEHPIEDDPQQVPEINEDEISQKEKGKTQQEYPSSISVILIKKKALGRSGFGSRIKMIFPSGYSNQFLRRFVYAGAKAIGLSEYESLNTEAGVPCFPKDFINTDAYASYHKTEIENNLIDYYKHPPAKRINYERIGSPYPFGPIWSRLPEPFVLVKIVLPQRVPKPNAIICLPSENDILTWKKNKHGPIVQEPLHHRTNKNEKFNKEWNIIKRLQSLNNSNLQNNSYSDSKKIKKKEKRRKCINTVLDRKIQLKKAQNKNPEDSLNLEQCQQLIQNQYNAYPNHSLERNIIGFITSGMYSFLLGKGSGVGFITRNSLQQISSRIGKELFLLVRNPSSRNYFMGSVFPINSFQN